MNENTFLFNHPVNSQLKTPPNPGGFPCFCHWKDTHTCIILLSPILWRKGTTTICQQGKYMLLMSCVMTDWRTWIPTVIINTVVVISNLPHSLISQVLFLLHGCAYAPANFQKDVICSVTFLVDSVPWVAHLPNILREPAAVHIKSSPLTPQVFPSLFSRLACGDTSQGCKT